MTIKEFDRWFWGELFSPESWTEWPCSSLQGSELQESFAAALNFREDDSGVNGLQVGDESQKLTCVALAVDACKETFEAAVKGGAQLLFVHHGLLWGGSKRGFQEAIVGTFYERIRYLALHGLGLYGVHLPLDRHPIVGNNAALVKKLGLEKLHPFSKYGYGGTLPSPLTPEEVCAALFKNELKETPFTQLLPFGPSMVNKVAIISGGAPYFVTKAIEEGYDLFITGDKAHGVYHLCKEGGINILFGGHYQTETMGVKLVGKEIENRLGLRTFFIDRPTGL